MSAYSPATKTYSREGVSTLVQMKCAREVRQPFPANLHAIKRDPTTRNLAVNMSSQKRRNTRQDQCTNHGRNTRPHGNERQLRHA